MTEHHPQMWRLLLDQQSVFLGPVSGYARTHSPFLVFCIPGGGGGSGGGNGGVFTTSPRWQAVRRITS